MEELAKKCIADHRQPMVKVTLPGTRLFFEAKSEEEKKLIEDYRVGFERALRHSRVDRRCGRARAMWLHHLRLAKVDKIVKNLLKFWGFQNKDGVFLYPEEMLYLMETNRLEVLYNNIPLTIDQAYKLVLETPTLNLMKYRVYKKLVSQGYKLLRFDEFANKKLKLPDISEQGKRKNVEDNLEEASKRLKTTESDKTTKEGTSQGESNLVLDKIEEIYEKLRNNMPVNFAPPNFSANPDYYVFLPTNMHKNMPDFHLYVCDGKIIDRNEVASDFPNIFAMCMDDVSFYRMGNVNIPFIEVPQIDLEKTGVGK